jgi:hypothetical protein
VPQALRALTRIAFQEYISRHCITGLIEGAVNAAVDAATDEPAAFIVAHLQSHAGHTPAAAADADAAQGGSGDSDGLSSEQYLDKHPVFRLLEAATNHAVTAAAADPAAAMAAFLHAKTMPSAVTAVAGRAMCDGMGEQWLEVEVTTTTGTYRAAEVPAGKPRFPVPCLAAVLAKRVTPAQNAQNRAA